MPIENFTHGTGVLVHPRESGILYSNAGVIRCIAPSKRGFDSHLFGALKIWVDTLRLDVEVNSTDGGKHTKGSRHYFGLAVDMWRIGLVISAASSHLLPLANLDNKTAVLAVEWLGKHGFKHHEMGPWGCVLLGPPNTSLNDTGVDHSDHIHFSVSH